MGYTLQMTTCTCDICTVQSYYVTRFIRGSNTYYFCPNCAETMCLVNQPGESIELLKARKRYFIR